MKIAFFEIEDHEKDVIRKQFKKDDLLFFRDVLDENNLKHYIEEIKDIEVISIFIYSRLSKKVISKLENLRFIATRSTGYDHVDITECKKRDIKISNVPFYGENTVAEYTFGLILSLSRKIHTAYERTLKGNFSKEGLQGTDLKGKTLGVVGTGSIGQNVIRIAGGFSMDVIAYDAFPKKGLQKKLDFRYKEMETVLKDSDILTFHVPHLKSTHHLLNTKNVKKLKKGVIVVNTSRGPITQSKALLEGITKGIISAVGLDTIEEESFMFTNESNERVYNSKDTRYLRTLIDNNILLRNENVIMTPHNAFNSKEALRRILDTTLDNIKSFEKRKIINSVGL